MVKTVAIVTCRVESKRLPEKCLADIYGLTAVGIVVERAKRTGLPVILATCEGVANEALLDVAVYHDVSWFQAQCFNKLKVWKDCFEAFDLERAILVDGDDLCWDYDIGKRAIASFPANTDMIGAPDCIVCGLFTKAIDKSFFGKLEAYCDPQRDTDVITRYIDACGVTKATVPLEDWEAGFLHRLTLDYPEDLEMFLELYSHLSPVASGREIITYLNSHSEITAINQFRQQEFLDNQAKFNAQVQL